MKLRYFAFAAVVAPFLFGTSIAKATVSGDCGGNSSTVYCNSFTPGDTVEDIAVVAQDGLTLEQFFSSQLPAIYATTQNLYDLYAANSWFNGATFGIAYYSNQTSVFVADPKVSNAYATTLLYVNAVFNDGVASFFGQGYTNSYLSWTSPKGAVHQESVLFQDDANHLGSYNAVAAVPGPEAGAGIGALAMGGLAFWMKRRRKHKALAA